MSDAIRPGEARRARHMIIAVAAAVIALGLGVFAMLQDAGRDAAPSADGPVLPNWSDSVGQVAEIEIRSAGERFIIARSEAGWALPSRGGHPVDAERLAALDAFLGALTYAGARTNNPDRHARLGLRDPDAGGRAVRVTARNTAGDVLADLLIGDSDGRDVFVRRPGDDQSWAARPRGDIGGPPDIAAPTDWLILDFLALETIARTRITPERGPAYLLERPAAQSRNFALREPGGWTPITAGAANGPGGGLSRVRFRDVRPAADMSGPVVSSHEAETFSGLRVTLSVFADGDARWAIIEADALTDDARRQADALSAQASGWAYLLSDLSVDRLLRPLDEIADPRSEAGAAPSPDED